MKKSKLIMATLTATVFATSVGALTACGDSDSSSGKGGVYEITFDANGGAYDNGTSVKMRTAGGRIASAPAEPTRGGYVFNGYTVSKDGGGTKITFGDNGYKFTGKTTVYAQWTDESAVAEYTVVFDANGGTIVGTPTTVQTVGGKLQSLISDTYISYEGHEFVGWYTEKTGGVKIDPNYVFTDDTTIYAQWRVEGGGEIVTGVYTVTFNANGGTLAGEGTAKTANGVLSALPTPVAPNGKVFDGWFTLATGGDKITLEYEFKQDATVYAHYSDEEQENPGDKLEIDAFYLIGDMTDWEILPKNVLVTMPPSDNMTSQLTVKFATTAENQSIKLWYNDGSDHGDENTKIDEFYIDGKKIAQDNNGKFVIPQIGEYTMFYKVYGDWVRIDLVKKIELPDPSTFKVKVGDVALGSNPDTLDDTYIEYFNADAIELKAGAALTITINGEPQAVFIDGESGGVDVSVTDTAVETITATANGTFVFYVKYYPASEKKWRVYVEFTEAEPDEITPVDVTFDPNGGVLANNVIKTDKYGRIAELPVPTPPKGMQFVGWFTATTGGVAVTEKFVFEADATVYARYEKAAIKPTFELNTENLDETKTEYKALGVRVEKGEVIEFYIDGEKKSVSVHGAHGLSQNSETGVVTAARGGVFDFYVKNYKNNPSYWEVYATDGVDTKAYYLVGSMTDVQWVWTDEYKLVEDGKDNYEKPQYSITVQLKANDAVRIWMSDNKWYNDLQGDADGRITLVGDNMVIGQDGQYKFWMNSKHEIYVEWIVGEQTVTFDANGGTLAGDATATTDASGRLAVLPTPQPPENMRFVGWYTAKTGGERVSLETVFEKATVLYAVYEDITVEPTLYVITFDANGGTLTGDATATTDEYGKLALLPEPTAPKGMQFIGWFTAKQGGDHVTLEYSFTEDKTIYALYEEIDQTPVIGMQVNGAQATPVVINKDADTETSNLIYEYVLEAVDLNAEDVVTFVKNDAQLEEFYNDSNSHGVRKVGATFVVQASGTFNIYVRYYDEDPDSHKPPCWVVEMTDGKTDELIENAYYLVGDGLGWKAVAGYELDENGSITLDLAAGEKFKIAKYDGTDIVWSSSFGYSTIDEGKAYATGDSDNNVCIITAGEYTITLKSGKLSITSDEVELPEPPADPNEKLTYEEVTTAYGYLVGKFAASGVSAFAWGNGYRMSKVGEEYQLTNVYLTAGDSVKVRAGTAFNNGLKDVLSGCSGKAHVTTTGDNIDIKTTGYYSFYWKPSEHGTSIWLEFTAA